MFLIAFTKKRLVAYIFILLCISIIIYTHIFNSMRLPAVSEHVVFVVAFVGPRRLFAVGGGGRRDRGHGAGAQGGVGQLLEVHARVARGGLHERLGVVVRETDGFRRGRALGVALKREEKVLGGAEALCHGAVIREQLEVGALGEQLLLGQRLGGGFGGGLGGDGCGSRCFRREGRRFEAQHRLDRYRHFRRRVANGRARGELPGALQRHRLGRGRTADNARLGVALGAADIIIAEGVEGVVRLGHVPLENRPRRAALPALLAAAGGRAVRAGLLDFLRHEVAQARPAAGLARVRAAGARSVVIAGSARVDSQGSVHNGHLIG